MLHTCLATLLTFWIKVRRVFGSVTAAFFRYDISMTLHTTFKRACETLDRFLSKGEVKMAGYWPSSFFSVLYIRTEAESRSIKSQKKRPSPISSHLD